MEVVDKYPVTAHFNNSASILLLDNISSSQRKNHIKIFHHFFRDCVEDGKLNINIFHSEGNIADPFTNILSNGPFNFLPV